MPYLFSEKNSTMGKHSVIQFEVLNPAVHCTGGRTKNLVTECLFKVKTYFKSIW